MAGEDARPVDGWVNGPCPWLPEVKQAIDFTRTRRHGPAKGAAFYRDALAYAQSQWMGGKPAQAVLQLNKAWMADLQGQEWLQSEADPYRALAWILTTAQPGKAGYLGNPVRHFQHLASRMSGPQAEVRRWRAWACLHLAERVIERARHPRDGRQLAREGLWIPGPGVVVASLGRLGWPGEADRLASLLESGGIHRA